MQAYSYSLSDWVSTHKSTNTESADSFDACHMFKLKQNLLANYKGIMVIKNGQKHNGHWKFIVGVN